MLDRMSIRTVSDGLRIVEVTTAVLIASRRFSARAAQVGGFLAVATFLTTLTFLFSTPGAWAACDSRSAV
jgi:reactive chlorine resistance protein C